jgi:hypothetical protein
MSKRTNRVVNPTMIADAVYYAMPDSGASEDKARGVIIGVVSGLMACGLTYAESVGMVGHALKPGFRQGALPAAWAYDINKAHNAR